MKEDSSEAPITYPINSVLATFEGNSVEFSLTVDGDALAAMSDSDIFRAYRFTKLTTEFRCLLFHELVRRAEAARILKVKFFLDNGLKYDTEYRFVKLHKELAAAECAAELNPAPVPELGIGEAGDEEATEREEISDPPTTTTPTPAPKAEKKPCHMCGVRKVRIEKMEKEILDLKQEKKDLKAVNKTLQENLDALMKERKDDKKAAVKKQNAEFVIPEYRKDTLVTGEFAIMQCARGGWVSIEINKDETAIDARLAELKNKAAAKAKSATA